jgi:hypothetical protein
MLLTVRVPLAVILPEASEKPPMPDRSLIDATLSVLILPVEFPQKLFIRMDQL